MAIETGVYHLFPLGCLGAPHRNDGGLPVARLAGLAPWFDHAAALGMGGVLLGPVFASATHGYDILDLRRVDPRLGEAADLRAAVAAAHARGLKVILDAVFNHVGRDHPWFRDVLARGRESPHARRFVLDFERPGPRGEAFDYRVWRGHDTLVSLDTADPDTRAYLLDTAAGWFAEFGIDGLRLDAADLLALDFQAALRTRLPEAWLIGEVIHGDYRRWTAAGLDSVTNYQLWKAIWSALDDGNLFELAHTLDRQFGPRGSLRGLPLGTFLDNHDTARIASRLRHPAHLAVAQTLLFAAPGVPFVYSGSEAGLKAEKRAVDDWNLRPEMTPADLAAAPCPELVGLTRRLADLRAHPALAAGDYETLHVASRSFAFLRRCGESMAVAVVNAAPAGIRLRFAHPALAGRRLADALGSGREFRADGGGAGEIALDAASAAVLL